MSNYDGEIVLSMKLTPDEVKKSSQTLSKEVEKIFKAGASTQLDQKFKSMLTNLDKLNTKANTAGENLEKALNQKIPTEAYAKISKEVEKLNVQLQTAREKADKFVETGGNVNSRAFAAISRDCEQIEDKLGKATIEMEKLEKSGKAFTLDYEAITKAKNEEAEINNQLRIANEQSKEYLNTLAQRSKEQRVANTLKEIEEERSRELLKSMKIENEEIFRKNQELQNVEYRLEALKRKQESLPPTIGPGTQQFRELTQEIVRTEQEYSKLKAEIDSYTQKLQTLPTQTKGVFESFRQIPKMAADAFKQLPTIIKGVFSKMLTMAKNVVSKIGTALQKVPSMVSSAVSGLAKFGTSILTTIPGIKQMTSLVGKLGSKLTGLGKSANSSGLNFKKLFMNILKYGLGIRGLFVLFRKLRSAITEGVKNLVQTNGGVNATNQAISSLMSSLNALKNAWGAAFAPIIQAVAPILTKFVDMLTQVAAKVSMFTSALTGKKTAIVAKKTDFDYAKSLDKTGAANSKKEEKAEERYNKAVEKAQKTYDEKVKKTEAKNAEAAAKAEEKQAKAAEKLAKKQEKANKQLGAYDQLNVIAKEDAEELEDVQATEYEMPELELPNMEDYMADLADVTDFDAMFEEVPIESAIQNLLDRIKEAWEKGDFTELGSMVGEKLKEKLNEATDWIVTVAQPFATKLGTSIATFANGLVKVDGLAASLGETLGEVLNTCADFMTGILDNLDFEAIGNFLADGLVSFFNTVDWSQMGHNFVQWYNGLFDILKGFADHWDPEAFAKAISDFINTAINDFNWEKNAKSLSTFGEKFLKTISTTIQKIDWNQLGKDIATFIRNIDYAGIVSAIAELAGSIIGASWSFLYGLVDEAMQEFVEWFHDVAYEDGEFSIQGLLDGIVEALKNIGQWIYDNIFKPFKEGFEKAFKISSPSKVFQEEGNFLMEGLKKGITDKIANVVKAFNELKTKVLSVFNSLKTSVINVWNTMWNGIKRVINSILGGVEKMANGVIRGFNKMISAINTLSFDIPDWVPEIGGNTLGFNIPEISAISIPRLAQGAVIPPNREFLALLGDQNKGTNIEAPLDTIIKAFNDVLDNRFENKNNSDIVLQLDGRTIAEVVWDEEEKRYKQRGVSYDPIYT